MSPGTALIAGGGIGGLAAGIALRNAGWHVRVFERAPTPRAEGFALSLAPNAVAALEELGVGAAVGAQAWPVSLVELRDERGALLKRVNVEAALGQARSLFVVREALHRVLLEGVGSGHVTFGCELTGIDLRGSRARASFRGRDAVEGDVLIGADGVGSAVRRWLHPSDRPPRVSGYIGIRGLARGPSLNGLSIVGYIGGGVEAGVIRAGAETVYWYLSSREEAAPPVGAPADALLAYAERLFDATFRSAVRATRLEEVRIDRLVDRDPVDVRWTGPVTLLGDASGPVLPQTGQGAALALEDAVALGLALRNGDPIEGLRRYEAVRARRRRPLVWRGRRIARFTTASDPILAWLRNSAIRVAPMRSIAAAFLQARRADPHRALR